MAIVDEALKAVCTKEAISKPFSVTVTVPLNPESINLLQFPSSSAGALAELSPIKAACSECRLNNVELYPLVKQGAISKRLAEVFAYIPPP